MSITRYTSPPTVLMVKGINIVTADIYVSIKQGTREINLNGDSLEVSAVGEDTQIVFYLTQEQTAIFDVRRNAKIQVNWLLSGHRYATETAKVKVYENLLEEVLA